MDLIKEYGTFVAILGMIIEGIGIYILWKKMPKELQGLDADAAAKYAEAAKKVAERNMVLVQRVNDLEKNIDLLETKVDELEKKKSEMDKTINEWAAGIDRLIHQVCSLDAVPVWKPQAAVDSAPPGKATHPKSRSKPARKSGS